MTLFWALRDWGLWPDITVLTFCFLCCFYKFHVFVLRMFATKAWELDINFFSWGFLLGFFFPAPCGLWSIWLEFVETQPKVDG